MSETSPLKVGDRVVITQTKGYVNRDIVGWVGQVMMVVQTDIYDQSLIVVALEQKSKQHIRIFVPPNDKLQLLA